MTSPTVETIFNTAVQLQRAGNFAGAETLYRQVLAQAPRHAQALHGLGTVMNRLRYPQKAADLIKQSLQLDPANPEAHYNLAQALRNLGDNAGAILAYQRATELRPDFVEAWNNLGTLLKASGRADDAITAFAKAIELRPSDIEPRFNLGNTLAESGNLGDAIEAYRSALSLDPNSPHVLAALGNALRDSAQIDAALDCYRRSLAFAPDPDVASNLAYTLYLDPSAKPPDILAAHRAWDRQFAKPLASSHEQFPNDRNSDRRIRIGYVSPDFSLHPVGRFIHPLLSHHDHASFEIFCYSDGPEDDMTVGLKASADSWRDTSQLSHGQLADQIRADGIDVLVDLAMHTGRNRLLTFARKPAPVQLSYLAYCGTTGVSAIDYRLTDPFLDPPAQGDENYSERSVRLPKTYWCFQPLGRMPDAGLSPALSMHYVTFGHLGSFAKASPPSIEAWLRTLQSVPTSRILIYSPLGPHRQQLLAAAAVRGISPDRIEFLNRVPLDEYFRLFSRIDITLDSFPCSGATTICDSLWMGVPVVTLAGTTAMSRSGLSVLSNAGLPELVAENVDQYVQLASNLGSDLPRLESLRRDLRPRMSASPLMDARQFTRDFESAIRMMWRTWCEGPQ